MFAKALTTAIVSAMLLGALQTSAMANGGGGGPSPWAEAEFQDGSRITSRGNRDGSRTITHRNRNGEVVRQERVEKKKKNRKPKKRGTPWASAYDPATGTRTTSVGLDQRGSVRAVISIGPFGIGFGLSN